MSNDERVKNNWTNSLRVGNDSKNNLNNSHLSIDMTDNISNVSSQAFRIGQVKGVDKNVTAKASNRSVTRDFVSQEGKKLFNVVVPIQSNYDSMHENDPIYHKKDPIKASIK